MTIPIRQLSAGDRTRLQKAPLEQLMAVCEQLNISYASALIWRGKRLTPVKAGKTPILNGFPTTKGDALVISDNHLPRHDSDFSTKVLNLAFTWGIRTCWIAGDLYDRSAQSPFLPERPQPDAEAEIEAGEEFAACLLERFTKVIYLMGNHDAWFLKAAIRALGISPERCRQMLGLAEEIEQTPYHHGRLISGGQVWQIEHPKNASITPCAVGVKLVAKFHCNMIVAHGHTCGQCRDASGKYTVIDSGGLFNLHKLDYVSLEHNTRPMMNNAAVIIAGGIGYLLDPLNWDYDMLTAMGRYYQQHGAIK